MSNDIPKMHVHDALTGEDTTRDMTPEEIEALPKATDETPTAD